MVWQTARAVKIPVIGMGGIMNGDDALEFMMAGATAVQIGTATFIEPRTAMSALISIDSFLLERNLDSVTNIIGIINRI